MYRVSGIASNIELKRYLNVGESAVLPTINADPHPGRPMGDPHSPPLRPISHYLSAIVPSQPFERQYRISYALAGHVHQYLIVLHQPVIGP